MGSPFFPADSRDEEDASGNQRATISTTSNSNSRTEDKSFWSALTRGVKRTSEDLEAEQKARLPQRSTANRNINSSKRKDPADVASAGIIPLTRRGPRRSRASANSNSKRQQADAEAGSADDWLPTLALNAEAAQSHETNRIGVGTVPFAAAFPALPGADDGELESQQVGRNPLDDPAMWAITYKQLMDLEEEALTCMGKKELSKATMRDINQVIIRPRCQKTGVSCALSLNPNGLMLDAFITHAWDEPFHVFVESVRHVFHTTLQKPNLWICAFALNQEDKKKIATQIGNSLEDSAFARALSKASMYVVVRNSTVDVYSRIWCVAELLQAKKRCLIPDHTFVTGPDTFSALKTSCVDAKAFDPKDRTKILTVLLNEHNKEEIDQFIHQFRSFEASRPDTGRSRHMTACMAVMCLLGFMVVVGIVALIVFKLVKDDPLIQKSSKTGPLEWAEQHPEFGTMPFWRQQQLKALATVYYDTGGDTAWSASARGKWLDYNTNECWWVGKNEELMHFGQKCDSEGRYEHLSLGKNGYGSVGNKLSPEISWLEKLTYLDLSSNSLHGTIPSEFGQLAFLRQVRLHRNDLSGTIPTELGRLTAKQSQTMYPVSVLDLYEMEQETSYIDKYVWLLLSSNQLNGTIPSELAQLPLDRLILDSNELTGGIPSELGLCTMMKMLYLAYNSLTGTIPSELKQERILDWLELQFNLLSGSIPSELGRLTRMKRIQLHDNQLSGTIPSELGKLTKLTMLQLSRNQLGGSIPSELGLLTAMTLLGLSGNQLTGSIPTELQLLTNMKISL